MQQCQGMPPMRQPGARSRAVAAATPEPLAAVLPSSNGGAPQVGICGRWQERLGGAWPKADHAGPAGCRLEGHGDCLCLPAICYCRGWRPRGPKLAAAAFERHKVVEEVRAILLLQAPRGTEATVPTLLKALARAQ